jgi:hypothetical protein
MRALKVLLATVLVALAVTAGFVVVAVLAGAALLFLAGRALVRRLRGAAPRPAPPPAGSASRPASAGHGEVIDITATEVPADRLR